MIKDFWFFCPMAELIIGNNIRWDQALLKQVQHYKQDGIVPQLADKNFREIALAVTIDPSGKPIKASLMRSSLMNTYML